MASEQRTFVFAVTFILLFAGLVSTIPADLQGQGETGDSVTPVNPNLLTDFAETEEYDKTDFTGTPVLRFVYDLPDVDGTTFECLYTSSYFFIGAHTLFLGAWLGGYNWANFINENGTNHGTSVSFTDIDNDAEDGVVRYTIQYADTGNSAGGFIFYWNTTTYTGSSNAWDSSELNILHGIGMSADTNVASLLLSLLFLQIPDVPFLVSLFLATPVWAGVVYVLWFVIKSMIPFLS